MESTEKLLDDNHPFRVTGVMMQYLKVCEREVWFEQHDVEIDRENEHIVKGTIVDEESYSYLNKDTVRLGPIAPDMLEDGKIVEVKPSKSFEDAKRLQLFYYLWYLEEKYDISKDGILAYPEQRERENISLNDEERKKVEKSIDRIYEIYQMEKPPELDKKPACKSCAYKDFCWLKGD